MIVFAGPSLTSPQRFAASGISIRPPARQGDVYLAALEHPAAIGIIDGYFDDDPSVWHKEILWALSQGIAVLGASSMGALRAAETDIFGTIGIGSIYEAYRDGALVDDDEVALVHGPAELGYPALSIAMVNIRASLLAAVGAGVIDAPQADHLIDKAKAQFFKTRTWDTVLADPDVAVIPDQLCRELAVWLSHNHVDQKARDADALMARLASGPVAAPVADFHFELTDLWLHATTHWRRNRTRHAAQKPGGYRLFGDQDIFD